MRVFVETVRSRLSSRVAMVTLMAAGVAGCSSDVARFDTNPFNSPQASVPRGEVTGSVQPGYGQPAPVARVERQPISSQSLPPVASQGGGGSYSNQASYPAYGGGSGSGYGASDYRAPSQPAVASAPPANSQPSGASQMASSNWSGGTAIIVGSSDTLGGLSQRYGVSAQAIRQANGLQPGQSLRAGQRLTIPRGASQPVAAAQPQPASFASMPAQRPAQPAVAANPRAAAGRNVHVVKQGETLTTIARTYNRPFAELAKANNITPQTRLSPGDQVVIPAAGTAAPAPTLAAAPATVPAQPAVAPTLPTKRVASAAPTGPVETARVASAVTEVPQADTSATKSAEATGALPGFRWPVRGRVIAGFGPKTNGQQNDGINLAVPEGTAVKAAEDGVVAYAGNELKGYGNLVLVRHANGYVSAYAHASELMVKRGDTVKRGQNIAKAGQTGNVSSPQLHFEIRKGSTPVDPMQFLSGT